MKFLNGFFYQWKYRDIFLYLIVGSLATAAEWVTFWIFSAIFDIQYLIATTLAFVFSTFVNWLLGRLIVFRKPESGKVVREIALIYLASLGGLLLNLGIMCIFVRFMHIKKMMSKMAATVLVFAYNYLIRKKLIYRSHQPDTKACL